MQLALATYAIDVKKELRTELQAVAQSIRVHAQELASANIRNIGPRWQRMRLGVISSGVYLAPQQRGRKTGPGKRANLAGLLLNKAMQPAVDQGADAVVLALEVMLDRLGAENGF